MNVKITIENKNDLEDSIQWARENCKAFVDWHMTFDIEDDVLKYGIDLDFEDEDDAMLFMVRWANIK